MIEVLREVPGYNGDLKINHDGSLVYYRGKLKKIGLSNNGRGVYKIVHVGSARVSVARLVYYAFIGKLPRSRKIIFLDGNRQNTHYLNLGPKPCILASMIHMRKVPGYDELYVNSNGTVVSQYGFEVNITLLNDKRKKHRYAAVCVNTSKNVKYTYVHHLVAMAYKNWKGNGKIIHIDGDTINNSATNLQPMTLRQYGRHLGTVHRVGKKNRVKRSRSIPDTDIEIVKQRLLDGDSMQKIAKDYDCSDMAIVRFRKLHFPQQEITRMNKKKGINTTRTPDEVVQQVVEKLLQHVPQITISKELGISPTVVCNINRKYIRTK